MEHSDGIFYYQISTPIVNSTAVPLLAGHLVKNANDTVAVMFPIMDMANKIIRKLG